MALCQDFCLRPPDSSSRRSSVMNIPREALPIPAFAWGGPHILAFPGWFGQSRDRTAQAAVIDTRPNNN
jgi:hypothetical protein